jgi:hypothetical protein
MVLESRRDAIEEIDVIMPFLLQLCLLRPPQLYADQRYSGGLLSEEPLCTQDDRPVARTVGVYRQDLKGAAQGRIRIGERSFPGLPQTTPPRAWPDATTRIALG